ncbi:DUF2612 domain-containing protein [Rhodanobacter hydrolyticus]|uniref:DUF2612 domain-containing protein n=1 Tax=Rhodanobacter hydrolyticus TaxID=2250595 RepID=A0ABW8J3L5_9GAMM
MIDYQQTILAQYQNSPILTQLIDFFNQWIDPCDDADGIYEQIWNIQTCNDYGLMVWGKIVNISRNIQIPSDILYFGFHEAYTDDSTDPQPFGQAPFWTGKPATETYQLSTEAYRTLIMVKALANITNCTVPSLNNLLQVLFEGQGRCYVVDTGSMQIRFVFEFELTPVQLAILINSGAVPRPAGVLASVMQIAPSQTFGFNEAGLQPFGQGTFFTSSGLQNAQ